MAQDRSGDQRGGPSQFQVSLLNVFRQAHAERDARHGTGTDGESERPVSARAMERRHGADQAVLKQHLETDLAHLMNTIHLEAVQPLAEHPRVRRSVVNFGLPDMTSITAGDVQSQRLQRRLRDCLIDHEPRLIPETVEVRLRNLQQDARQRVAFDFSAEMSARPVDIPLTFVAEIDVGAGRADMSKLETKG